MRAVGAAGLLAAVLWTPAAAAELRPHTLEAFERYVRAVEARIAERIAGKRSFLWVDESEVRRSQVRQGKVITQPWDGRGPQPIRDGLIHDWIGAIYVPGATLERALALLRDYDNHYKIFQPEVMASRVLEHDQDRYRVYLRLHKKKVITVVLNSEHDVEYYRLDATRWHSRSYSTKIAQLDNAGEPGERELPVGNDGGYLWRLYSYWRIEQRDGGVYLECEAVSLTRDIPTGLGWLIVPIIR
ncbi:MAG TPA: hypothetical protein VLH09_02635, partial [Bryobacteraceae bacterium]|nr:hypothetical protein [Bryobacteraceae bacterium]